MKIILVNYRYFFSGGPERYMFNIKDLLEQKGHEVIPFSVKHNKNMETPYEKYFLSPIGSGDAVYFSDMQKNRKTIRDLWKGFSRMIYSFEAKKCFERLLHDTKPDIVYILYFQSKISCSIVDVAYKMGIPVVQRISDYSLLVPCSIFFNQDSCRICEMCIEKSKWHAVKNKCVLHSSVYSLIKTIAIDVQNMVGVRKKISKFIFPSSYTLNKFVGCGYNKEKLVHIPTLFNDNILRKDLQTRYDSFGLYIGRLDPDKGLMTLLDAFISTNYRLKIIGYSSVDGYSDKLEKYIYGKPHKIEFLGKMQFDEMQEYLSKCLFTIVPSEWYDNLPNTILESYAMRKCVVATDIGSLSENILDGQTGLLFKYKDALDLRKKVSFLFTNPEKAIEYGKNARELIDVKFNVDTHIQTLVNEFQLLVSDKQKNNEE